MWNGTAWSALGNGTQPDAVYALAVDGCGAGLGLGPGVGLGPVAPAAPLGGPRVFVGGDFTSAGGVAGTTRVAMWDGGVWTPLENGTDSRVKALAVMGSRLVVGGDFTVAGSISADMLYIAQWDIEQRSWAEIGSADASISALAVSGSTVFAGGDFSFAGGTAAQFIAAWNGSKLGWSPVGGGMDGPVRALAANGSWLYAGGDFVTAGGTSVNRVAGWDGTAWTPLGSGFDGAVNALATCGNLLFAGGEFGSTGAGDTNLAYIAVWNGQAWSPLGGGVVNDVVYALAAAGTDVYVGGAFADPNGDLNADPVNFVAIWNTLAPSPSPTLTASVAPTVTASSMRTPSLTVSPGTSAGPGWRLLAGGTDGAVYALAIGDDRLFVGGVFTMAGEILANRVAIWSGASWATMGSGTNGEVNALAVNDSCVYAGGDFTVAGGASAFYVAKWDGNGWTPLGSGLSSRVFALAVSGNELFVGGRFSTAGGVPARSVAMWNGAQWMSLESRMDAEVNALAIMGNHLVAGGAFTTAGGMPASKIATWNRTGWNSLGSGISARAIGVTALAVNGTYLLAGGEFTNPSRALAVWNGSTWTATAEGLMFGAVYTFAIGVDTTFAGGALSTANVAIANGTWRTLGGGTNERVFAIVADGRDVYIGGKFTTAGGGIANYIAMWSLATGPPPRITASVSPTTTAAATLTASQTRSRQPSLSVWPSPSVQPSSPFPSLSPTLTASQTSTNRASLSTSPTLSGQPSPSPSTATTATQSATGSPNSTHVLSTAPETVMPSAPSSTLHSTSAVAPSTAAHTTTSSLPATYTASFSLSALQSLLTALPATPHASPSKVPTRSSVTRPSAGAVTTVRVNFWIEMVPGAAGDSANSSSLARALARDPALSLVCALRWIAAPMLRTARQNTYIAAVGTSRPHASAALLNTSVPGSQCVAIDELVQPYLAELPVARQLMELYDTRRLQEAPLRPVCPFPSSLTERLLGWTSAANASFPGPGALQVFAQFASTTSAVDEAAAQDSMRVLRNWNATSTAAPNMAAAGSSIAASVLWTLTTAGAITIHPRMDDQDFVCVGGSDDISALLELPSYDGQPQPPVSREGVIALVVLAAVVSVLLCAVTCIRLSARYKQFLRHLSALRRLQRRADVWQLLQQLDNDDAAGMAPARSDSGPQNSLPPPSSESLEIADVIASLAIRGDTHLVEIDAVLEDASVGPEAIATNASRTQGVQGVREELHAEVDTVTSVAGAAKDRRKSQITRANAEQKHTVEVGNDELNVTAVECLVMEGAQEGDSVVPQAIIAGTCGGAATAQKATTVQAVVHSAVTKTEPSLSSARRKSTVIAAECRRQLTSELSLQLPAKLIECLVEIAQDAAEQHHERTHQQLDAERQPEATHQPVKSDVPVSIVVRVAVAAALRQLETALQQPARANNSGKGALQDNGAHEHADSSLAGHNREGGTSRQMPPQPVYRADKMRHVPVETAAAQMRRAAQAATERTLHMPFSSQTSASERRVTPTFMAFVASYIRAALQTCCTTPQSCLRKTRHAKLISTAGREGTAAAADTDLRNHTNSLWSNPILLARNMKLASAPRGLNEAARVRMSTFHPLSILAHVHWPGWTGGPTSKVPHLPGHTKVRGTPASPFTALPPRKPAPTVFRTAADTAQPERPPHTELWSALPRTGAAQKPQPGVRSTPFAAAKRVSYGAIPAARAQTGARSSRPGDGPTWGMPMPVRLGTTASAPRAGPTDADRIGVSDWSERKAAYR